MCLVICNSIPSILDPSSQFIASAQLSLDDGKQNRADEVQIQEEDSLQHQQCGHQSPADHQQLLQGEQFQM